MGNDHRPGRGRVGRPPGPNSTPASRRKARRAAQRRRLTQERARRVTNEPRPRQTISNRQGLRRSVATGVALGAAIAGARIIRDLR